MAVVVRRGVAVTITRTAETTTRPAGKETTITMVVVPIIAVAEVVMAVVEARRHIQTVLLDQIRLSQMWNGKPLGQEL